MFHSLSRWFHRSAAPVALLALACSGIATAQLRHYVAPDRGQGTAPAPLTKLKTPAEQVLIPYLKAHAPKALTTRTTIAQPRATSYAATPPFGGYINAPMFDARTTASTGVIVSGNGVSNALGGDFDKDGKTDIAVLQQDGTLNILINDGKGGLKAPVSYLNPYYQTTAVFNSYAVDVNGDGNTDIVAFDFNNNNTITWLNLGNGTFNAAVTTALDTTYGYPNMIYVADVNSDGKADLIYGIISLNGRTSATIYLETQLGAGDGTFGTPAAAKVESFTLPSSGDLPRGTGIAVGDINGDGKPDIALAIDERFSVSTGTYVITTALGNNDGTFTGLGKTSPISIPAAASSSSPVVEYFATILNFTDVNGDGKLDLVADVDGTLQTALGKGDGTFAPAVSSDISAVTQAAQTVLLDVNGDGKLDAVVAGGTMAVYLGNGDGTFAPTVTQYAIDGPDEDQELVVADFDNDGVKDIAQLAPTYKQVVLFSNTGKGGFHGAPLLTAEGDPNALASGLLTSGVYTNSSYSDALYIHTGATSTDLVTMVSDGKGNFTSVKALATYPTGVEYFEPIHGDFNGDGLEDIVYADTTGGIWVGLSKGDGTFTTPVSAGLPTSACPVYYGAAGDLNGDGKVDLVIPYGGDVVCGSGAGGPTGYYVALGNGDGTFSAATFVATGTELYSVTLGDLNGDGVLDLVIDDAPLVYGSGYEVSVALGNGDGSFGTPRIVLENYLVSNVAVADINNDGKADLVLSAEQTQGTVGGDTSTGGILTMTGNGDGTFNSPSMIGDGNFFYGLKVADMNNDGNADIVATLYYRGTFDNLNSQPVDYFGMVTLLGYGNGEFAAPYNSLLGLGSQDPQVGHFVNDGALDAMATNIFGTGLFIGQGGSTFALTTSSAAISFGAAETLTAKVTPSLNGRPVATGTVAFYDGATLLGTTTLSSGSATLTLSTLAAGKHTVKAVYAGDSNFNPNTSANATITVATLAPGFTLTGTPATVSVTGGAQGVVTLNLAANASFSGAITLTCSGMPTNGSCAVNPGSVTLAAGGTSTATLVIGTSSTHSELKRPVSPWNLPLTAASFASLFGVFVGSRKRMRRVALFGFGLVLSVSGLLIGCGGSGANSKGTAPVVTAGSYTVTVTATPASGSAASAQTATVSLSIN